MPIIQTTEILEILEKNSGSYIQHSMGNYKLKNKDGSDMVKTDENGNYLIEPTKEMIDDLIYLRKLTVYDTNKYKLF